MNRFYSLLPVLMVAVLTACGDGGGGAGSGADPPLPVQSLPMDGFQQKCTDVSSQLVGIVPAAAVGSGGS